MEFRSLSEWMLEKNSGYYKNPSTQIYGDFLTYAQSEQGLLAKANATDFYSKNCKIRQKKFQVLEIGVGNGSFAKGFLNQIISLDEKNSTNLASSITYTLADFSEPMLKRAVLANSDFSRHGKLNSVLFDASAQSAEGMADFGNSLCAKYDLIRCNELFSDLPANLFVNLEGAIFSVHLNGQMAPKLIPVTSGDLSELELKLIYAMPQGYFIPINRIAANSVSFLSDLLSPSGIMDIFDYGFYLSGDFNLPAEMWNLSIVREYGSQWTVDLNFLYICALLGSTQKSVVVEPQKDYVQAILGKKLSLAQEDFLDYSAHDSQFEEDDSFYHLRVLGHL